MIQSASLRADDCRPAAQTTASGFQGKKAASVSETETEAAEQTTTSSIVEADGCKMLVVRRGKIVTMKIKLGDVDAQAPEDPAQKAPAQANEKATAAAGISPQQARYLHNDAAAAGLAGGLLYTGRA